MNKHTLRRIIQVAVLIAVIAFIVFSARVIAHRYCPYAVICFGTRGLNPQGDFVFVEAIIAGLLIVLLTLFIGRRFCGYICPLGTISEYLNYLNPFRKKMKQIPPGYERVFRNGKYLLLLFNIAAAGFFLARGYFTACPVMTLTSLPYPRILYPGIFFVGLIVLGNILIIRAWCRYLCPYAALLNCAQFAGKFLPVKKPVIYRNLETCIDCYGCQKNCQMNINLIDVEYIEDFNCIYCLDCIEHCPRKGTLTQKFK